MIPERVTYTFFQAITFTFVPGTRQEILLQYAELDKGIFQESLGAS